MYYVVGAMRRLVELRAEAERDKLKETTALDSLWNRRERLRTFLGLYQWTYALLPLGIMRYKFWMMDGAHMLLVTVRTLHIFGFRVARWVVDTELHRKVQPERRAARLKLKREDWPLRTWTRKKRLRA